ncbi:MAG TPA: DUF5906 domain-containing protein [Methanosarcina sp.]|jgi:putative DNA primase/helicase
MTTEIETFDSSVYDSPDEYYMTMLGETRFCADNRVTTAKNFIKKYLLDEPLDFIESFLVTQIKPFFNLNREELALVKNSMKNEKKTRNELQEREARLKDLKIDKKYDGMYTIHMNNNGDFRMRINPHPDKISDLILKEEFIITYRDNVYIFRDGYYRLEPQNVTGKIVRVLNDICKGDNADRINQKINDVMAQITTKSRVNIYPFNRTRNVINLANCVLIVDNDTGDIHSEQYDPREYVFNYCLPVKYYESAPTEPIMNEISKYTDKPDAIIQYLTQVILQSMGYSPFKTAFLLYGPPDSGKTTLLNIYRKFIGNESVSAIALGRMSADSNNRFSLAPLEGKLANIKDELSYFKIDDSTTFKDVTGSYDIWVEPKGKDAYQAKSTAVHAFAVNDTPSFDSRVRDDDAFWKRWLLIPCTKAHFTRNEKFTETLLTDENMSGLLNEVIKMVSDYVKGIPLPYQPADDWENTREEWMRAGNPLYKFITENMDRGGNTAILKSDLLKVTQQWCDDGHLLYKKARPETVNDLIPMIKLCNGTIDERRNFHLRTPDEINHMISNGMSKNSMACLRIV